MPGKFKSRFSLALSLALLVRASGLAQIPATQLQLTADRTRIKAGERIRVSIVPAKVAREYSFAVGFQDGPIDVLPVGQNEIEHDYLVPGTYIVSVTPRALDESPPTAPDFLDSRVTVHVDGAPMTAEPESLSAGEPVRLTIDITPTREAKTKFRFNFGDGSSTGWREDRQITYTYTQPDVYRVQAEIFQEGWAQAVPTIPIEVNVHRAARAAESVVRSTSTQGFVGSISFWVLIAAALAAVSFVGLRARQRRPISEPSYKLHRVGSVGNMQSDASPEILLEVVLIPGIAAGRHYISKMEVSRTTGDRRTNG